MRDDLKPSKILVTDDVETTSAVSNASVTGAPVVKILDFGLARATINRD